VEPASSCKPAKLADRNLHEQNNATELANKFTVPSKIIKKLFQCTDTGCEKASVANRLTFRISMKRINRPASSDPAISRLALTKSPIAPSPRAVNCYTRDYSCFALVYLSAVK